MPESKLEGIEGEIKWFDPRKGYGFIVGPEGQDIFVHFSVIQAEGRKTLHEGQRVSMEVTQGEKGPQAENVMVI